MAPKNSFFSLFNLFCFAGVALFIALLIWIPKWTVQRDFEFPISKSGAQLEKGFPLDKAFSVIHLKGQRYPKQLTLGQLLEEEPKLLINFWATWCPPCLDELPSLEYLNRELELDASGTLPLLVTISVDAHPDEVHQLVSTLDFKPSFLVLHDPEGHFAAKMSTFKFPETYLIAKTGTILEKWIGPQNWLSEPVISRF